MKPVLSISHPRWLALLALLAGWIAPTAGARAQDVLDFFVSDVCIGGCEHAGVHQVPEYSSVTLGCKVAVVGTPSKDVKVKVILFVDGAPYKIFDSVPWQPTVDPKLYQPYTPEVLLKVDWIATVAGTHTVLCKIDAAHAFKELFEKNNTETATFVVGLLSAKKPPGPKAAIVPGGLPVITPTPALKRQRGRNAATRRIFPPQTPTPTPAGRRRG